MSDSKTLVETVKQIKPSTCCLDTLPTNLFKNVFDCLARDILQIVNNSHQSGNLRKALYQFLNRYIGSLYVRELILKSCCSPIKYITDMLPLHKPARPLRSSETNLLITPRVTTKHGKAGFSYYSTNSWNKFPEDLRLASTLTT